MRASWSRRGRRLVVAACVLALAVGAAAPVTAAATGTAAATVERIERHVEQGLAANNVPGAALGIVAADGTVHLRGFGTTGRDGRPVTADTPLLIGSVTKSFTALAVMQLVEQGAVDLDAPVTRYLPWFTVEPARDLPRVTVRTLMTQTSGLPALVGSPAVEWMQDLPIAEAARQLAGTRLTGAPGSAWEYANGNYVLLGAIIEAASGQTYGEFLTARVLEPLGMDRTFTDLRAAQAAGMADGHRYWFGRPVAHTAYREGMLPSGLLISTATDMSRYLRMWLGGGELDGRRIVSQAGVRELTGPVAAAHLGPWAKEPAAGYAMGWFAGAGPFGPEVAVFHPGATPDSGALAAMLPDRGSAMVLMVNAAPRVNMPGAAGAVDRIAAGAVSVLMDAEPATGATMTNYYRVFNLMVAGALLAVLASLARSRRGRAPARSRLRRMARVAGAALPVAAGVLLLAVPVLLGLGWRQLWLWAPDHALALLVLAAALLAVGGVRATRLVRHPDPGSPDRGPHRSPTEAAPAPAPSGTG